MSSLHGNGCLIKTAFNGDLMTALTADKTVLDGNKNKKDCHIRQPLVGNFSVIHANKYNSESFIPALSLPALVHFVVIFLVIAARYIIHPCLVVKIPADGFLYSFLELQARLPSKLHL